MYIGSLIIYVYLSPVFLIDGFSGSDYEYRVVVFISVLCQCPCVCVYVFRLVFILLIVAIYFSGNRWCQESQWTY